jgi:hypothetical protein
MKKVSGQTGLFKDEESHVIINRDSSERDRYRIAKENSMKAVKQAAEIERLSNEMSEIKSLLLQLTKAIT